MEEDREKERGGEIKAERSQRGRRERHRQENVLSFSLSPSLPHSPTHSSKYNDHRKVISKLSQSEDSEPTESHKKKHRETEGALGSHSPVLYVHRNEQLFNESVEMNT